MNRTREPLVGKRFGRLVVIRKIGLRENGATVFSCRCDCGKFASVQDNNLRSGNSMSCGCLRKERLLAAATTHGKYGIPEHSIWRDMLARCRNKNVKGYKFYGARGIRVCDRWHGKDGFANFLADMGNRPSAQHTIDRFPNQSGNYEPGNCRWATRKEQAINRKSSVLLAFDGRIQTMRDWENERGFVHGTIYARIKVLGWSISDAITTPMQKQSKDGPKKRLRPRVTCATCNYRVRFGIPQRGNCSARLCNTHYYFIGNERIRCTGSGQPCKEDKETSHGNENESRPV